MIKEEELKRKQQNDFKDRLLAIKNEEL